MVYKTLVLILTFFASVSLAQNKKADPIVLRWGVNVEPIVYYKQAAARFKAQVEARSGGKIRVDIFENEVKEENHDHLYDVISGRYDMGQSPTFHLEDKVPEMAVWNIPFLFKDDEHVQRYMASSSAKNLLAQLKHLGVEPIDYTYSGGFLWLVGDKVSKFENMSHGKLGVEASSVWWTNHLKENFHIESVSNNYASLVKTPADLRVSEIIASTLDEIIMLLPEAKKMTINESNHRVISRVMYISSKFLNSLPKDLRKIIREEARDAAHFEKQLSIEDKFLKRQLAEAVGIAINTWTESDRKQAYETSKNMRDQYSKRFGTRQFREIKKLENPSSQKISQNKRFPN